MNVTKALQKLIGISETTPEIDQETVDALRKIVDDTSLPWNELQDADFSDVAEDESSGGGEGKTAPWQ